MTFVTTSPPLPSQNICIGIVFYFSAGDIFMSQEKSKTMIMQNFGGVEHVYYGIWESREWFEPRSHIIIKWSTIVWLSVVLRRSV